ncbi:hypothetical protein Q8791_30790 [Nocardiopsis sp. CT-R113]|uniref:Uncharacterized protein n=1 Tax=Nocardiopsis codii TaxID=3065942 RepID=A0ABU7KHX1_9ACTN|nr:hypothetical protein [Nocardiopsis sp. CT-R113]MEE2041617.1 hypothetical protein [Nocardiopsis sp. CT-R113]
MRLRAGIRGLHRPPGRTNADLVLPDTVRDTRIDLGELQDTVLERAVPAGSG